MFNSLFRGRKIKVQLIEALSNETFGLVKLLPEQLPASFDKQTTMHIEGEDWIVEKAEPLNSEEFARKGELALWLKKVLKIDPRNVRYSLPTISNDMPEISSDTFFKDFTHTIHEDDWRQMEFLPVEDLSCVHDEMKQVEAILFPEDDPGFDSLNGFDRIHIRDKIKRQNLSIPLDDFTQLTNIKQKGNLAINGYTGYVAMGFSFRSENHIYYGTMNENTITELYLDEFEGMDEEIHNILAKYNLLLVCWCRGMITSG